MHRTQWNSLVKQHVTVSILQSDTPYFFMYFSIFQLCSNRLGMYANWSRIPIGSWENPLRIAFLRPRSKQTRTTVVESTGNIAKHSVSVVLHRQGPSELAVWLRKYSV